MINFLVLRCQFSFLLFQQIIRIYKYNYRTMRTQASALKQKLLNPQRLTIVDSGPTGDNSCVFLSSQSMEILDLEKGDLVQVHAFRDRKNTIAVVYLNQNLLCPLSLQANHVVRKNLGAIVGDSVQIEQCKDAIELDKLVLRKIGGHAPSATSENHEQKSLGEYFGDNYRPVCRDDVFEVKTKMGNMQFMIAYTEPFIYGYVTENTMIAIDWENDQI